MQTAATIKPRLSAYLNLLPPPFSPHLDFFVLNHTGSELEADGVLHFQDPSVIRPFRVSKYRAAFSVLAHVDGLPSAGPIVYLIIGVIWQGFEAAVKLAPQTFPELEGALCV